MSRSRKQKANGGNSEATNQQVDRDQILFVVAPGVENDCGPRFVSLLNKAMKEEERRLVAYHGLAIIIVPDGSTETPPAPEALQGRKLLFIAESAIKTYENESDSLSRLKFTVLITVFGNGPVSEESWNIAKSQPMSVTVNVDGAAIQIPISNSGLSILPNALSKAVVLTAAEEALHRMTAEGSIQSETLLHNVKLYQTYTRFVEEKMALMKKGQTRTKNALEAEKNRILKEGMNGIRIQIVGTIPPETVVTFCNDVIKKWDKRERQLLGSRNLTIVFDGTNPHMVSSKENQLIIGQHFISSIKNEVNWGKSSPYRHLAIKFSAYFTALGMGQSINWEDAKQAALEHHAKADPNRFQMLLGILPDAENRCAALLDQAAAILRSPDLKKIRAEQPSIENLIDAYNQYLEFVSQQVAEMHRQPKENKKLSVADTTVDLAQSGVMLGADRNTFPVTSISKETAKERLSANVQDATPPKAAIPIPIQAPNFTKPFVASSNAIAMLTNGNNEFSIGPINDIAIEDGVVIATFEPSDVATLETFEAAITKWLDIYAWRTAHQKEYMPYEVLEDVKKRIEEIYKTVKSVPLAEVPVIDEKETETIEDFQRRYTKWPQGLRVCSRHEPAIFFYRNPDETRILGKNNFNALLYKEMGHERIEIDLARRYFAMLRIRDFWPVADHYLKAMSEYQKRPTKNISADTRPWNTDLEFFLDIYEGKLKRQDFPAVARLFNAQEADIEARAEQLRQGKFASPLTENQLLLNVEVESGENLNKEIEAAIRIIFATLALKEQELLVHKNIRYVYDDKKASHYLGVDSQTKTIFCGGEQIFDTLSDNSKRAQLLSLFRYSSLLCAVDTDINAANWQAAINAYLGLKSVKNLGTKRDVVPGILMDVAEKGYQGELAPLKKLIKPLWDNYKTTLQLKLYEMEQEKKRISATPYPATEEPNKQPELENQTSPELKNATEEQQQRFAEAFEKVPDYAKRIIIHEEVSFTTGSHPFVEINVSNKNVTLPVTIVNNPAFKSHIFASGLVATLQPHIENNLFETALNEFFAILPSHLSSQQIERAMWKHGIEHCQATVLAHAYDQIDKVKADNSACRKILNIYKYAAEQHIANASLAIPINGSSGKDSQHTQPSIPNLPIPYVLSLEQKHAAQADSALRKEIDRLCSKLDCGLPLHQALGTAALADPVVKLATMYHDYQGAPADKKQENILTLSDVLKENVTLEALKLAQRAWKEASNLKIGNIRDTDPRKQNKLRDNQRDLLDSLDRDCPTIYAALNGDIERNIQEALKPAPYTHTLEFPPKANRALLAEVQNLCQNINKNIEVDKQLGGALFKGPVSKLIVASSTGISGNIGAALRDESNKNKGINEARKTAATQLSNILASDHPLKKVLSESPIIVACVYGDKERILEALGLADIAARRAFVAEQLLLAEEAQTSITSEKKAENTDSQPPSPKPKENEDIPEKKDQMPKVDDGVAKAKDQKTADTTPKSAEKLPGEEADENKGKTGKSAQKKALPPPENSEEALELEDSKRIFESRLQNDPALSPEELNSRRARAYEAMSEQLSVDALYVAMTAKDNGYNQYRCDLLVDKTHARIRLFFKSDEAGKLPYSKIFDLNSTQYIEGYARLGVTPTSLDALNLQIIVNGEIAANGDFLPIFGKTTSGKPRITKDDFIPNRAINKDDRETALKVSNAGIYQLELTAQYTKNGDKVTIVFPLGVKEINGNGNGTEAEAAAAELLAKERMEIIEKFIDDYNSPNAKRRKIPIKREIQSHLENIVAEIRVVDPQNPNGHWATPEHIELLITDGLKKAYLGATDPAYQLLFELPKGNDRDKALKAAEDALPRVVVVDKEDDWVNWKGALTEIGYGQYRHTPVPIASLDEAKNQPQNMTLGAMAMSKGGSNQTYHLRFTLHVNDDPVNNTSAGYLIRTRGMNLGIEDPEMARSRVQEVIFGSDKAMGLVYMLQDYFEQRPQARWLLVEKKGEGGESTKELAGNVQKEVSEVLIKEQIHLYRQMIKNELPADNMSYRLNIVREEPEYGLVTIRVQIQQKLSDDLFVIAKNTKGENLELFFAVPEKKADLVESYVRGDMDHVRLDRFVWDLIPRFEHDLSVRMDRGNPQDKDGPIPVTFSVMRGRRDGKLEPHLDTTGVPVSETRLIPQKHGDMIHSFEETVAEHLSLLAGLHYSPLMPSTPFTSSSPYVALRQEVLAAKELGPQYFIDQRHPPFNADKPRDWLAHAIKSNLEVIFGSDHGIPDPVKKGSASNGNSNLKDLREQQRVSREVIGRMRSNPGDPGWRM